MKRIYEFSEADMVRLVKQFLVDEQDEQDAYTSSCVQAVVKREPRMENGVASEHLTVTFVAEFDDDGLAP